MSQPEDLYLRKRPVNLRRNWATDPTDPTRAWLPEVEVTQLNYFAVLKFKRLGKFGLPGNNLLVALDVAEQMLEREN